MDTQGGAIVNKVNIKPLSVNEAWQGRRFKTPKYKKYEQDLLLILPKAVDIPEGPLVAHYEFGVSNSASDWDNGVKPFQDVLQKRYGFDDRRIYRAIVDKVKVKKGQEYVKFRLEAFHDENSVTEVA